MSSPLATKSDQIRKKSKVQENEQIIQNNEPDDTGRNDDSSSSEDESKRSDVSDNTAREALRQDTEERLQLAEKQERKRKRVADRNEATNAMQAQIASLQEQVTNAALLNPASMQISSFQYAESVKRLSIKQVLSKEIMIQFTNQFHNKEFTSPVMSLIDKEAWRVISTKFLDDGFALNREQIAEWSKDMLLHNLEELYKNNRLDESPLEKLRRLKLTDFYTSNSDTLVGQNFINDVLVICENMTQLQRDDRDLQNAMVGLLWRQMDNLEPMKVHNEVAVKSVKTLDEFVLLIGKYRSETDRTATLLETHGYDVRRRPIKLNTKVVNSTFGEQNYGSNNHVVKGHKKQTSQQVASKVVNKNSDSKHLACYRCGRSEFSKQLKAFHSPDNCYVKDHPDSNKNPNVTWKDSVEGKAFAAMSPPKLILPSWMMKDGSIRDGFKTGELITHTSSEFNYDLNCTYLVTLLASLTLHREVYDFLPLLITQVQSPTGNLRNLINPREVECLLDSGSHAGDFVSLDIVNILNITDCIILDDSNRKVCSGLDSNCSKTLGSIQFSFLNEVNKNFESETLNFKILLKSPIDIIIGRRSIKLLSMVSRTPSHFYDRTPNNLCTSTYDSTVSTYDNNDSSEQTDAVHRCGCQRHPDSRSDVLLNVTQTEIQVTENTNRLVRRSSEPSVVGRNMLSNEEPSSDRSEFAPPFALWNDIPLPEPRVGGALLGDIPPQSLMAATQTHAMFPSLVDGESYKLNDELIYQSLYSPLYGIADIITSTYVLSLSDITDMINPTSPALLLNALVSDIPSKFIDDDGIDQLKHDSFAPWLQVTPDSVDLLTLIHIEGDEALQLGIRVLCEEYKHIFALTLPKEASTLTPFNITVDLLKWRVPKNRGPPRVQSSLKQVEIAKQVTQLLEQGIIVPSPAEYYSQVLLSPKPDGTSRLCIDYRNLNEVSDTQADPIPNIKQMLNRIGDHRSEIFGVMDLCQGYHQNAVSKSSMIFTAFIVFCGIYHFCRLPFGPKKAPSHFQQQMAATVLVGLLYYICEVYLDDIIVHGKTTAEFLERLRKVFERIAKFKIKLKPNKCKFGLSQVEYCGRVISKDGLSMSAKKIASVMNFPEPVFAKQLKSFLGLANYFREFVPNHSTVVHPLQALIPEYRRSNRLIWNAEARLAFTAVKTLIDDCPTMYFLVPECEIFLHTDASDYGVGGYLFQLVDNKERPVAFVSKSLTATQLRWPVIQKEAYAIFASMQDLMHLLRDRTFVLRTDHKNLLYISESSNPMIIRWYMAIQELDYTKQYLKGESNVVADDMSRLCPNLMTEEPDLYDHQDILCSTLNKFILSSEDHTVISTVHNSLVGHHGLERTIDKLTRKLKTSNTKWQFLRQKVKRFIQLCPCCQKMSQLKIPIHASPFTVSSYEPMENLNIDFIGPYPDGGYVLVFIDMFTRWVELYCCDAATSENAALSLLSHFGRFGSPAKLTSDRGSHFVADIIEEFLRHIGTEHILTLAYSKEENSLVERANKEVNRHLIALTFDKNTVDDYKLCIPIVQRILNSSYNERTGISAAELLFGNAIKLDRGLFLPPAERNASVLTRPLSLSAAKLLSLQDKLISIASDRLQLTDSQRLGYYSTERTEYAAGDYVLVAYRTGSAPTRLHTNKMGPMRVISNNLNTYVLLDLVNNKQKHYHITDLTPFIFDPSIVDPLDVARKDYLEFFIDKIIEHRGNTKRKKSLEFLIQWVGYDSSYNSWEPWNNFRDTECLHEYLRDKGLSNLIPKKFN